MVVGIEEGHIAYARTDIVSPREDDDVKGVHPDESAGKHFDSIRKTVLEQKIKQWTRHGEADDNHLGIDRREWRAYFFRSNESTDVKVGYFKSMGQLNAASSPEDVALFMISFYDMNKTQAWAEMVEKVYCDEAVKNKIHANLLICSMINQTDLARTPFENYAPFKDLISRLCAWHFENARFALHLRGAKDAHAQARPADVFAAMQNAPPAPDLVPPMLDNNVETKPEFQLLQFLLQQACAKKLCRTTTAVYQPVYTTQGSFTHFYVHMMDLNKWIYQETDSHQYQQHYITLLKDKKTLEYLVYHLKQIIDVRFPYLNVCRTLFSYENGIYNADTNMFYPYVGAVNQRESVRLGTLSCLFANDAYMSTAQYFPGSIVPLEWFKDAGFDWARHINTAYIDKIFRDQGFDDRELGWVRTMHGRLQHDMNGRHEDWQQVVHTKGPAGCGKSVIAKVLKAWYPAIRFGILNDDIEGNFPDSHLVDSFIIACFDVSPDFELSPTRFLCWASSDDVNIKRKYDDPISKQWTAPVMFFSNYNLPVQGGSGSAIRRAFTIALEKPVQHVDGALLNKALAESPFYLIKCAFDYHAKAQLYGKTSIWDDTSILPPRFWQAREAYAKASSWADCFLLSGTFVFDPSFQLPVADFKREYRNFQQTQKALPGVNRSRKYGKGEQTITPCEPAEFANALRSVRQNPCFWDTEHDCIVGLKFNTKHTQLEHRPDGLSQTHKRPRDGEFDAHAPKAARTDNAFALAVTTVL